MMDLETLVGQLLTAAGMSLAVAESCTGGLLSHRLTNVPGSSSYFLGSVVSYADRIKTDVLGVRAETLQEHGAVSAQAAAEMARSARRLTGSDIAVSTTGVAGPGGATIHKPVGLVFLHLSAPDAEWSERRQWVGGRRENKEQTAHAGLYLLQRYLERL
jgi:PncC family amidohydrolase